MVGFLSTLFQSFQKKKEKFLREALKSKDDLKLKADWRTETIFSLKLIPENISTLKNKEHRRSTQEGRLTALCFASDQRRRAAADPRRRRCWTGVLSVHVTLLSTGQAGLSHTCSSVIVKFATITQRWRCPVCLPTLWAVCVCNENQLCETWKPSPGWNETQRISSIFVCLTSQSWWRWSLGVLLTFSPWCRWYSAVTSGSLSVSISVPQCPLHSVYRLTGIRKAHKEQTQRKPVHCSQQWCSHLHLHYNEAHKHFFQFHLNTKDADARNPGCHCT